MCGIVGTVGGRPDAATIAAMIECVAHRGPDGRGQHLSDNAGFGHVRLAIVDPSEAGAQPMRSPDGRYVLIYNGELYNHQEFRAGLESHGIRFRGHSDTETLLWLLITYGERILPRLNGIFAFAFEDTANRTVLLARDPLGVKPLYYATASSGQLLFASEIKALFAGGGLEPRANLEDLVELFMFHFVAGERTAFANVRELLPGHALRHANGAVRIWRFWNAIDSARGRSDAGGLDEQLRLLLRRAVERQLMADVPIGVKASGGLDSGVITGLAGRQSERLAGFCFRDVEHGYDELDDARRIGRSCGVDVEEVRIDAREVPNLLEKLTWHNDEPLPRPHHVADFAVASRAQASGLKVLLSGEGGDELFGGYERYVTCAATMTASGDLTPLVLGQNDVALPRLRRFWSRQDFANPFRSMCAHDTDGLDLINRQLLADQRTFLQHFLQRSDRMGMAAGVEVRVPLLDVPLVEYVNGLPGTAKVSNGTTKVCLRSAVRGLLPEDIVMRRKQAFEMPMAPLLGAGPVAEMLDDLLLSTPRCGNLFDVDGVRGLVQDFRAGQGELWKMVWLLLTFELWLRVFKVAV